MRKGLCPYCKKIMPSSARICEHCGETITVNSFSESQKSACTLNDAKRNYSESQAPTYILFIIGFILSLLGKYGTTLLIMGFIFDIGGIITMVIFNKNLRDHWVTLLLEYNYAEFCEDKKVNLNAEANEDNADNLDTANKSNSPVDEIKNIRNF